MSTAPQTIFAGIAGKKTQLTFGGAGPPLLYLHSAAGEADWLELHAQLAERFTVYLPAHPGFALSAGLERIQDIQDLAWHCVDLLEYLELPSVTLVGFSLGGWLAAELAILRPHLVERLVLINSAGVHLPDAPVAEIFGDDIEALGRLIFADPHGAAARQIMPRAMDDPRMLLWLRAREATARVAWNPYLHNPRLPDHLQRIVCPTLVLWGGDDRLIPPAHGRFFAERIPGARLQVVPDGAHMLPLERPDLCAGEILRFSAAAAVTL